MIKQPNDKTFNDSMKFEFNPNFANNLNKNIDKAQKALDSEVIKRLEPYWWRYQGISYALLKANTVIGSGVIQSGAPYDARLNYNPQFNFRGAPMRGGYPFQRMKSANKDVIKKKVQDILNE